MSTQSSSEPAAATLALVGVALAPERAARVAETLRAQIAATATAFAAIPFEAEPATYLKASAEGAP